MKKESNGFKQRTDTPGKTMKLLILARKIVIFLTIGKFRVSYFRKQKFFLKFLSGMEIFNVKRALII